MIERIKSKIANPTPDIEQFARVVTGKAMPRRVHLAELFADPEVMQWITEDIIGKKWVPIPQSDDRAQLEQHLLCKIEYQYRMGYDYVLVNGGITFAREVKETADTAGELARTKRGWVLSKNGPIQSWDDFEAYSWPEFRDENLWMYDFVAQHLPEGMGLMACPESGFLEVPMELLIGYEALCLMIYDQPDLVKAIFEKVRNIIVDVYSRLISIDRLAGFFQGDDMGYRSGTLFSPEFLKEHSLPGHKIVADIAHKHGKIYMLHSCGKLDDVMDCLIDDIGIDAKQSFEDVIVPVEEFYEQYGERIGVLGGVDVDMLARADELTLRNRIRKILDRCMPNGRYALGSGNTITNYCKKENVLAMFDEAYRWQEA